MTKFFVPAVLILSAGLARAAKVEFECPEEIKTKQSAAAPVKGWESLVETAVNRQIFSGLTLFNGHPKDGAPLFEDPPAVDSATPPIESIYKIPQGHEAYVSCSYMGTLVRMIKKLPKDVQTCRVRFSEALGHVQKAVCE